MKTQEQNIQTASLMERLENVTANMGISRDFFRIVANEIQCIPSAAVIAKDPKSVEYTLKRLATLLGVFEERIERDASELGDVFEQLYAAA